MSDLLLTDIRIYPIKSLGGFSIEKATVLPKGILHDRRWMLIDQSNRFMTQRLAPAMALFHISYDGEALRIDYDGSSVQLPHECKGDRMRAQIWKDEVEVVEVDEQLSEWFSERLGTSCRLVHFPEESSRPLASKYGLPEVQVSLADGHPLLIIGESSLYDLNNRLEEALPMNRFRPNLVFSGGFPFEEDRWSDFSIGDLKMRALDGCARCTVTTVDQETARVGVEPLKTLATFRKVANNIFFGMNVIPLQTGVIKKGDRIVLE